MNNLITYLITLLVGFFAGATCVYAILWYKKNYTNKVKQYECDDLNDEDISIITSSVSQKDYIEKANSVLRVTLYDKNLDTTRRKKNELHVKSEA
jgi:hypothetical protein